MRYKRSSLFIRKAILVAAATLVGLAIGELLLRIVANPPELMQAWVMDDLHEKQRVLDRDTLFIRPEYLLQSYYKSSPERLDIVCLGDSFTEGPLKASNPSYPTFLKYMLEDIDVATTVVNVGLTYSGNDQHLAMLKTKILPMMRPDILIYQFCFNDLFDNIDLSLYRIEQNARLVHHGVFDHWLFRQHQFLRAIPLPYSLKKNLFIVRAILGHLDLDPAHFVPPAVRNQQLAYSRRKTELFLETLTRLAERYGFTLYLTMVDLQVEHLEREHEPFHVSASLRQNLTHDAIHKQLIARRDNFIDTHFIPSDLEMINRRFHMDITGIGRGLFLNRYDPCEWGSKHYNKYGYWLFAKKIRDYLLAHDPNVRSRTTSGERAESNAATTVPKPRLSSAASE
jgi:hypothetical protein